MATEIVLITGANGYLALHIIQNALNRGWNIVGTKPRHHGSDRRGLTHSSDPKDQKTGVLDPAINGGLAVLTAASRYGCTPLKRVIHVGSFSSTVNFELGDAPGLMYGPDTCNPITYEQAVSRDYVSGYVGSKVLVERAMWDFMKAKRSFDLVTVLPATIFGPHIAEPDIDNLNISSRMIWELACPSKSPSPWHSYHMGAWVDV
ncbi:putative Epimerase domain-containing protein [Seiridium cardinale]